MRTFLSALLFALLFAAVAPPALAQEEPPRVEVGPVVSYLRLPSFFVNQNKLMLGGRFTYNFNSFLSAEGEYVTSPRLADFEDSFEGGHTSEGLFGAKLGFRSEKFGIFAKFRPGFVRFSRVIFSSRASDGSILTEERPWTNFAFDFGGAIEYYPSRRFLLRLDLGDTLLRLGERTLATPSGDFTLSSSTGRTFQLSGGFAVRF